MKSALNPEAFNDLVGAGLRQDWGEYQRLAYQINTDLKIIHNYAPALTHERVWNEVIRYPFPNSASVAALRRQIESHYRAIGRELIAEEAEMIFAHFFANLALRPY